MLTTISCKHTHEHIHFAQVWAWSVFANPWTVAHQAPLSMGFPRQEYWSSLTFPSLGDLPDPGIDPESPALAGGFLTCRATMEAHTLHASL